MPDCHYCDHSCEDEDSLAAHLATEHEWSELNRIDRRRIKTMRPEKHPDLGPVERNLHRINNSSTVNRITNSRVGSAITRRRAIGATVATTVGAGSWIGFGDQITRQLGLKEPVVQFATVSDGHWGSGGRDFERLHGQLRDLLIQNAPGFLVHGGDIADQTVDPDGSLEALRNVQSEFFEPLEIPYTIAHGNHDAVTGSGWNDVFGVPFDHTFEYENLGFIILNSTNQDGSEKAPDTEFLATALDSLADKDHVFVVSHYWFSIDLARHLTGAGGAGIFSDQAMDLIHAQENVTAVIHGHNHGPTHRDVVDITHNGREIPYVMTGVFGGYYGDETVWGFRMWDVYDDGTVETSFIDLDGNELRSNIL